jgi:hypothetical protein
MCLHPLLRSQKARVWTGLLSWRLCASSLSSEWRAETSVLPNRFLCIHSMTAILSVNESRSVWFRRQHVPLPPRWPGLYSEWLSSHLSDGTCLILQTRDELWRKNSPGRTSQLGRWRTLRHRCHLQALADLAKATCSVRWGDILWGVAGGGRTFCV